MRFRGATEQGATLRRASAPAALSPAVRPSPPTRAAAPPSSLSPGTLLARARLLGHRPAGAPLHSSADAARTVQRYTVVPPAAVAANAGATVVTHDLAQSRYGGAYRQTTYITTSSGADPAATRARTLPQAQPVLANTGLPSFRVSQSGTLAVADEGQPRHLYAEAATVDNTNRTLRAAGATVRLLAAGAGIQVPSDPADTTSVRRPLQKVHAATEAQGQLQQQARLDVADAFDVMNCNDFIQLILGAANSASRYAVLHDRDSEVEVPAAAPHEPIHELSRYLAATDQPTARGAAGELGGGGLSAQDRERAQIDYEGLDRRERSARAAAIGVNEAASPEVGEGFVIRSQGTAATIAAGPPRNQRAASDKVAGYQAALVELRRVEGDLRRRRSAASARVQRMLRSWGEHYAGVVAKDGPDIVTLENYNRSEEYRWEHERIFNNLFEDFEAFRNVVAQDVVTLAHTPDEASIQRLVGDALRAPRLAEDYKQALEEAQASFLQGLRPTLETTLGNYFFQMYGPGEQSFHAAYQDVASNPVTLRVRELDAPVVAEARQTINGFASLADDLRADVEANPVPDVTADLRALYQQARVDIRGLRTALTQTPTRAAAVQIDDRATTLKMTLRGDFHARLVRAYRDITDQAFRGQTAGDLRGAVDAYVGSYSAWNSWGPRYNKITALQALTTALAPSLP